MTADKRREAGQEEGSQGASAGGGGPPSYEESTQSVTSPGPQILVEDHEDRPLASPSTEPVPTSPNALTEDARSDSGPLPAYTEQPGEMDMSQEGLQTSVNVAGALPHHARYEKKLT